MGGSLAENIIAISLAIVWGAALWSIGIYKIATDGAIHYFMHLTNWAWTLSAFFFLGDLMVRIKQDRQWVYGYQTVMFWVTNGVNWVVFWIVWIVLDDNPALLQQETKDYGGKYEAGFVFNMNSVFHVLPSLVLLVYTVLRREELCAGVRLILKSRYLDILVKIAYGIFVAVLQPVMILSFYVMTNDAMQVYHITTNVAIVVLTGLAVILFHNGIPFVVFATS
jgi:hypothetical protein